MIQYPDDSGPMFGDDHVVVISLGYMDDDRANDYPLEIVDVDYVYEVVVARIMCKTSTREVNTAELLKGLDQLIISLDDSPHPYRIFYRERNDDDDNVVLAMMHHTLGAAGFEVRIYQAN